jgi:hypothetical protein
MTTKNISLLVVGIIVLLGLAGTSLWLNQAYFLGGTFSRQITQAQQAQFTAELEKYGLDAAIMESFPAKFRIPTNKGMSLKTCQLIREFLQTQPYIQSVGECRKLPFPLFFNPEQGVESPPLKTPR